MEQYALLRFSSSGGGVPHPEFLATVFRVCTVLRVLSWVSRDFLPLFGVLAHFWPPPPLVLVLVRVCSQMISRPLLREGAAQQMEILSTQTVYFGNFESRWINR